MPSFSFITISPGLKPRPTAQDLGLQQAEAAARSGVADVAVAEAPLLQQHRVLVTIDEDRRNLEPVAGRFSLRPQLIPRARKERRETALARPPQRILVHEADHQHF